MVNVVEKLIADGAIQWFSGKATPKSDNSDGKTAMLTKVLMAIAVFAFVAYLSYKSSRKSAELAKLKHERDLAEEAGKQAALDWKLAAIDEEVEGKLAKLLEAITKADILDQQIVEVENEFKYGKTKIEAIKNWDDFDGYLRSIDPARLPRG